VTSALGGGGWSASYPGRFTPGKGPVPIVQEAGWDPGPVWTCSKNLAPTGIRSPNRPASSQVTILTELSLPPQYVCARNLLFIFPIVAGRGTVSGIKMRPIRRICHHHKGIEDKKKLCDAISRINALMWARP
jgi:hypothetical protein